ncbi:MAG: hypothetical protein K0S76_1459 [Herbinix sp.]|jgi:uncharacterized membrane protein YczE|nr:hypothetical protein [Herbinix sp.]
MKFRKKLISFFVGMFFCILGSAMEIKAGIGAGAFNAFALSFSNLIAIDIGFIIMVMNIVWMLLQLTVKRVPMKIWLRQIFLLLFGGFLLNFFVYTVMGNLVLPNYITRLLVMVSSSFIGAFGIVFILESKLIMLPLEGYCDLLSERYKRSTGFYRQMADVFFIVSVILLSLFAGLGLTIREGTIIGALLFGPAINFWRKIVRKLLGLNKVLYTESRAES